MMSDINATSGRATDSRAADVILVAMPYGLLNQPSLALSLLKPALERAGVACATLYPSFEFAARIGLDVYGFLFEAKQEFLVGEWTFAGVAFPDFPPDASYLDFVLSASVSRGLQRRSGFREDPRAALWAAREAAAPFVEQVARQVLARQPRIVGCTSTFTQHCSSLALLRKIREFDPTVVTVLGGANCEGEMGVAARRVFPWLDFVVSGDGDVAFPELCRRILDHGPEIPAPDLPYGVLGAGHPALTGEAPAPRASIARMDDTCVPDFDDYFAALAASELVEYVHPALPIETSRGCWWGKKHHCTFCGLNGGNMDFRSKNPDRVVAELATLSSRYGLTKFNVVDNILDLGYIQTLLPRLSSARPYTWFFETKANLRRDQLATIAAAGIRRLQPGIESLHDDILRLVDKGTTALQSVQLLKWARELGVFITWNFLWDVPGERDEWYSEMAAWLPAITHLQPPGVDRIQFHRFSPYHFRAESFGLSLRPHPLYARIYPLAANELDELAYYFEDPARRSARDELAARPGLKQVMTSVARWRASWGQDGHAATLAPLLLMEEQPDGLRIRDTRPGAIATEYVLEGSAAAVYRACGRIRSSGSLREELARQRIACFEAELESVLAELVERRLLLAAEDKYLALALTEVRPIPDSSAEFPGGYVAQDAWERKRSQGAGVSIEGLP